MRKTFLEKCINLRLCRVALVLLFLVPAISSLQANPSQNKTISGVVTSATDSEPLIGVSVQVRETATGGITDIDGRELYDSKKTFAITNKMFETCPFQHFPEVNHVDFCNGHTCLFGYFSQDFTAG